MKTFEQYNSENPEIWKQFKETTLNTIKRGFKHYSSKSIFEIIRWHKGGDLKTDAFKINNNYTCFYARKFMEEFPQYNGFFRTRATKEMV